MKLNTNKKVTFVFFDRTNDTLEDIYDIGAGLNLLEYNFGYDTYEDGTLNTYLYKSNGFDMNTFTKYGIKIDELILQLDIKAGIKSDVEYNPKNYKVEIDDLNVSIDSIHGYKYHTVLRFKDNTTVDVVMYF